MATPNQLTRMANKQVRRAFRAHKYQKEETQRRVDRYDAIDDKTPIQYQIRQNYYNLLYVGELVENNLVDQWRRMRLWSTNFGMPLAPEDDLTVLAPLNLRYLMATNNELTSDQEDNYVLVEDLFTPPNSGKNRFERLLEMTDALADFGNVFEQRMNWFADQWDLTANGPRKNQVIAIFEQAARDAGALQGFVAGMIKDIRDEKGEDDTTVPELRLRARLSNRRSVVAGGLYAIKRGTTTATGLPAGPEPDEVDPDINTARDEPAMATDVV